MAKSIAKRTPIKAIRAKCLDCTCGQVVEVRECLIRDCPLWEYRMGHRPKAEAIGKENISDEKTQA